MNEIQKDFFGEPHIEIDKNKILANACNRLLLMYERNKSLFAGGEVGKINRRLYGEILWEDGLQHLIPPDKKEEFINIVIRTQESDVYSRALRTLVYDLKLIPLDPDAIRNAERMRARLKNFK
jgi:hypothetical protein